MRQTMWIVIFRLNTATYTKAQFELLHFNFGHALIRYFPMFQNIFPQSSKKQFLGPFRICSQWQLNKKQKSWQGYNSRNIISLSSFIHPETSIRCDFWTFQSRQPRIPFSRLPRLSPTIIIRTRNNIKKPSEVTALNNGICNKLQMISDITGINLERSTSKKYPKL